MLCYYTLVICESCTVGSSYQEYDEVSDPRRWYLNLQLPATCSGNVIEYTVYYYPVSGQNNRDYRAYISMWTPTASGYQKVRQALSVMHHLFNCSYCTYR